MATVGLNGNDAPETIEGIPAHLWFSIQARSHTAHRREIDSPDFGLGLADGLRGIAITEPEWRDRVERSFGLLQESEFVNASVRVAGGRVSLNVEINA